MNKFKSLVLAVIGLLCSLSVSAYDFKVNGIYYSITSETDKTVAVTYLISSSDSYSGAVTIPESVTYSGSTYSVTSIGSYAFQGCGGLISVVIPNSVTSIGSSAFWGCYNLRLVLNNSNFTFKKGSESYGYIAYYAVVVCNGYEQVDDFIFTEEDGACSLRLYVGNETELVLPANYKGGNYGIGSYAFYDCDGLTSVVIPNSVTCIGSSAFRGCGGLNSVVIPNSVTSIGSYAFSACSGLTSVVIPNSVTSIEDNAFEGCSGLTSVVIPNSVTSINY